MMALRNDFPAGVITGDAVSELFALAKHERFAIPAANCVGSNSMNAVLEAAGKMNGPVIVQFSTTGAAFVGGKNVPVDSARAAILGSVAGARHVRTMAATYGARVILHTDHCPKTKLAWIAGLLDEGEQHFESTGEPPFSSHMLDLSEEPMEENLDTCVAYLKRMAPMGMTLDGSDRWYWYYDSVAQGSIPASWFPGKPGAIRVGYESYSDIAVTPFTAPTRFKEKHTQWSDWEGQNWKDGPGPTICGGWLNNTSMWYRQGGAPCS